MEDQNTTQDWGKWSEEVRRGLLEQLAVVPRHFYTTRSREDLRADFAGQLLASLLQTPNAERYRPSGELAKTAVAHADALLAALYPTTTISVTFAEHDPEVGATIVTGGESVTVPPTKPMECSGECRVLGECSGEVRSVQVSGNGFPASSQFYYCESAIDDLKRRGFTVTESAPAT